MKLKYIGFYIRHPCQLKRNTSDKLLIIFNQPGPPGDASLRGMDTIDVETTNKAGETVNNTGVKLSTLLGAAKVQSSAVTIVFAGDDGYTGELLDRPALDRLRDDAKKGLFEAVLVHSPDRLARNFVGQCLLKEELAKHGVKLIYLNGPTVYEIPIADAQLEAMERQLQALWAAAERAIESDDFPTRVGPLCEWCSFQSICPAWADAEPPEAAEPYPG